jgi:hypothetical protein
LLVRLIRRIGRGSLVLLLRSRRVLTWWDFARASIMTKASKRAAHLGIGGVQGAYGAHGARRAHTAHRQPDFAKNKESRRHRRPVPTLRLTAQLDGPLLATGRQPSYTLYLQRFENVHRITSPPPHARLMAQAAVPRKARPLRRSSTLAARGHLFELLAPRLAPSNSSRPPWSGEPLAHSHSTPTRI